MAENLYELLRPSGRVPPVSPAVSRLSFPSTHFLFDVVQFFLAVRLLRNTDPDVLHTYCLDIRDYSSRIVHKPLA